MSDLKRQFLIGVLPCFVFVATIVSWTPTVPALATI